jgi:phage terminase small subunit
MLVLTALHETNEQAASMSNKHRPAPQGELRQDGGRRAVSSRAYRHSLFIREYLIDRNATRAAIHAGYNPRTAYAQGHRLLKNAEIARQIEAATTALFDRLEVTKERITRELAAIAFSDVREFVRWGMRKRTWIDKAGNAHVDAIARVDVLDSTEIDPDAARVVSEIGETRAGVKLKLYDKLLALKLLGLELGMFSGRIELDSDSPLRAIIEAVQRDGAALPINDPNARSALRAVPEPAAALQRPAEDDPSTLTAISPLRRQRA